MLAKTHNKSAFGRLYSRLINKFIFFTFYEQIWGCMFFAFVLLASFIIKKMVDFHMSPITKDIIFMSSSDWKIVIASGFINWLIRDYFTVLLKETVKGFLDPVRYKTEEERNNRATVVIKWILDFIYYACCTVAAYFILSGQDFIPWQMGGSGECRNSLKLIPNVPEVPGIREYYLIQFGVHLYSFIYQILMKRNDNKFYEFLAHHGFAVMLIGFSYSMNFLLMGSIVLYTHDASDALLVLARAYSDMKFRNKHLYAFFGVMAFLCWIYTRLYVFPKCVIKVGVEYLVGSDYTETWDEKYRQLIDIPFMYMQSMAMVLLIMHIYWAIFMWKALFIAITKKKVKIEYEEKEKINN